jgi:hypothetical protein
MRVVVGLVVAVSLATGQAQAYCSEPTPPSRFSKPDKPDPPSKPFCASMNNCSQFDVDIYNSSIRNYNFELERYSRDIQDYIRKLNTYIEEAVEYAKCEVRSLED